MAGMDRDLVIAALSDFIEVARVERVERSGRMPAYVLANNRATVDAAAQVAEQILDRALPGWRDAPWDGVGKTMYARHRLAATRAIAHLQAEERLAAMLGDGSPQLSAGGLHPLVWESAKTFWASDHRREAVNAAARAINARAQAKLQRRDLSEWRLLTNAFSTRAAAPGEPRLRLMGDDGSDTFTNLHEGAGFLARGLFQALRNPANHELLEELGEQEALEQLAAFSVLARWVDGADVVRS